MWIFNHPQPALLFLVPMCTIPVAVLSLIRKEFMKLECYSTDHPDKKKKIKKPEDHGILDKLFDQIYALFAKN